VVACGDGPPRAGLRSPGRAAVRRARRQKPLGRWWAAEAQRTRGMRTRRPLALGAALPRAKGPMSHRLQRWETPGVIGMTRTRGGKTARVSLTAAGRQQARQLTGSDAEGGAKEPHNPWWAMAPAGRPAMTSARGRACAYRSHAQGPHLPWRNSPRAGVPPWSGRSGCLETTP